MLTTPMAKLDLQMKCSDTCMPAPIPYWTVLTSIFHLEGNEGSTSLFESQLYCYKNI